MNRFYAYIFLLTSLVAAVIAAEPRVVCYYTNWSVYRPVRDITEFLSHHQWLIDFEFQIFLVISSQRNINNRAQQSSIHKILILIYALT